MERMGHSLNHWNRIVYILYDYTIWFQWNTKRQLSGLRTSEHPDSLHACWGAQTRYAEQNDLKTQTSLNVNNYCPPGARLTSAMSIYASMEYANLGVCMCNVFQQNTRPRHCYCMIVIWLLQLDARPSYWVNECQWCGATCLRVAGCCCCCDGPSWMCCGQLDDDGKVLINLPRQTRRTSE
jgi:hypothetical protein